MCILWRLGIHSWQYRFGLVYRWRVCKVCGEIQKQFGVDRDITPTDGLLTPCVSVMPEWRFVSRPETLPTIDPVFSLCLLVVESGDAPKVPTIIDKQSDFK